MMQKLCAVFMGMGEPMLNLDNVVAAVAVINKQLGIGARSITISTVGVKGQLQKLAAHKLQCVLAVSLHAPDQALRCACHACQSRPALEIQESFKER
jgi:23S rRNA (adenine2503-C2)-methyltransferase